MLASYRNSVMLRNLLNIALRQDLTVTIPLLINTTQLRVQILITLTHTGRAHVGSELIGDLALLLTCVFTGAVAPVIVAVRHLMVARRGCCLKLGAA